jgi:thiamine pyrophosphokinase
MTAAVGRALVLADGTPPTRAGLDAAWPGWDDGVDHVVAADGGARLAPVLGVRLDRWVGDGDSLTSDEIARLEAAGVAIRRVPQAKDESDTELALLEALEVSADVAILGALGGGRIDHTIANLGLLAHPALLNCSARLLDDTARVTLLQAHGQEARATSMARLEGRIGDIVSLLPVGDGVEGVTTENLEYPLRDEPLPAGPARGLSNVRTAAIATVRIRAGRLLIVESPATLNR